MLQGSGHTDSPERKLKVGLLALLPGAAALAVAVLLVGLAAGSTGVQAQEAGATYTGSVDVLVEATCGGGTISLRPGIGDIGIPMEARVVVPFWGTRAELAEVIALARQGRITAHVETFPLESAAAAYDKLRAGKLRGRAVITS